jgi:hypothetical protein
MTTNATIYAYATDLQALYSLIKVTKTSVNPHFKNRYVPLDSWLNAVHSSSVECGFIFTEFTTIHHSPEYGPYTVHTCRLLHTKTGTTLSSDYLVGAVDKPQAMGSALTYARRYNIQTLLAAVGEDDDDGNLATSSSSTATQTALPMARKRAS